MMIPNGYSHSAILHTSPGGILIKPAFYNCQESLLAVVCRLLLIYAFRNVLIREDQMNPFLITASILVSGSILMLAYKLWPK